MKFHPHDSLLLEAFGSLSREQRRPILEHLEQCARCRERLRTLHSWRSGALSKKLAGLTRPPAALNEYDSVLDHALRRFHARQAALERERSVAVELLPKLLEELPERRELLLKRDPKYQTWGLLELLVDEGNRATQKAPVSGEPLVQLALTLTNHLDESYYGRERLEDFRARTWSILGNTLRMRSELPAAEAAFQTAERHLRNGTGDPLERADVAFFKAPLWRVQRKFDEALHLLERALSIYHQAGDFHRISKTLLHMGMVHDSAGRSLSSIALLEQASKIIEPLRSPMLSLTLWHNLANELWSAGRFLEAQRAFLKARPLYSAHPGYPDRALLPKRLWIEGRLALVQRQFSKAQELLRKAQEGLAAHGLAFEAAEVTEDLKVARLGQNRGHG